MIEYIKRLRGQQQLTVELNTKEYFIKVEHSLKTKQRSFSKRSFKDYFGLFSAKTIKHIVL